MNPLEAYLAELRDVHSTGAGVAEASYYPALSNLLNEIGKSLKPKVRCVINLANRGAGLPDAGLFTADQFQKGSAEPKQGQPPARGVVEAKGPKEDVQKIAQSKQVERYCGKYGLVLVTNLREFLLLGRDATGKPAPLEAYKLAENERALWAAAAHPQKTAKEHGEQFCEYLKRVMLSNAPLTTPQDLAWFLASYARDAKARIEHVELPALGAVRKALEEALGMKFIDERGEHFFRSTLVQTLFYGVFSAWVVWHQRQPGRSGTFDWHAAEWSLHVPFIRTLYHQIAAPDKLGPLGLVEVLDWTAAALNRVDRETFFEKFQDEHAVQYFYEPFLEAFDPELRKELGVWFTPREIARYQVARIDTVLREELAIADGLADPDVVVFDPCCGTGTYLVEVLAKIAETLRAKGGDALLASDLKKAAMHRVFGFELLPAPFVVSHLQLGLLLNRLGAPLVAESDERVGVYLTNALTGWEPPKGPQQQVLGLMDELRQERDAAAGVKRGRKILVVLGNPPYNAFAGVSPEEEQGLVEVYKGAYFVEKPKKGKPKGNANETGVVQVKRCKLNDPPSIGGWGIKKFNLDDLYVRFFRLAERRIAEMTGKGVVSFISNQSWITEPSFVLLRQHLLGNFDRFWIENLHGNRKISEYAPDGRTSETIFAVRGFSVGIQQGVATSLWVKTGKPRKAPARVRFRDDLDSAKADDRRQQLLDSLKAKNFDAAYALAGPRPENRFSFRPENVARHYAEWPRVADLCALPPGNGLMEKRGGALIDVDREELAKRMRTYFDKKYDWNEYLSIAGALAGAQARFAPQLAREKALGSESFREDRVVRYALRPFDARWCYYTSVRPIWNEPRPALWAQCWPGNEFLMTRPAAVASPEGMPFCFARLLGDNDALRGHAYYFPLRIRNGERLNKKGQHTLFQLLGEEPEGDAVANLSQAVRDYLDKLNLKDPDTDADTARLPWIHVLAVGYSPAYLTENADGVRRDWPRIPLPDSRKALLESAALGRRVAALLDTESEVPGVTAGKIDPLMRTIGVLSRVGGGTLDPDAGDLAVSAGWGHAGKGGVTMPARGHTIDREYDKTEREALAAAAAARGLSLDQALALLGRSTRDVYLNDRAYWKNVPTNVWEYYIGGYQVIKKWLSYREEELLGRALRAEEAREVMNMTRRLAAIVLMQPALDKNYRRVKAATYSWRAENV
jgi:hypothetical protein